MTYDKLILLKGKNTKEVNDIKNFLNRVRGVGTYTEKDFTTWGGLTNEYSILFINGIHHIGLTEIKNAIL